MNTLKSAATDALAVQNACNLSGVLKSFDRHMPAIKAACPEGTEQSNKHPVCMLFATQICHLTGVPYNIGFYEYSQAYAECERLANEPDPVV